MSTRSKLFTAALIVAASLAIVTAGASARRFNVEPTLFFIIWPQTEQLRFAAEGFSPIECRVLMEGEFHSRTIAKVSGQLVGEIRIAQRPVGSLCTSSERFGEMWILNGAEELGGGILPDTLPWHVRYDRFTGTLPRITGMRLQIVGASFLLRGPFGITCLYRSTAARPLYVIFEINAAAGQIETLRVDETQPIPRKAEELFCPATVTLSRRALVSTFAGNPISIRLVA